MTRALAPGTIVLGPFWGDGDRMGVGIVVERGHRLWTRVDPNYVPVKVINGDRIDGGYRPDSLIPTSYKAVPA